MMQAYVAIVLGIRGAGKSRMLYRELLPNCTAPAFVLDSLGGDFHYGVHFSTMEDLAQNYLHGKNRSGVYVLNAENDEQANAFFRTVHEIGKIHPGQITLVVDEIDKYCSTYSINPDLNEIIRYGRRYGIDCLFASRRTAEISTHVRSQADCFITFRQIEPTDVKAIQARSVSAASIVRELELFRNTGKQSEFLIIGELPNNFVHLLDSHAYISLTETSKG